MTRCLAPLLLLPILLAAAARAADPPPILITDPKEKTYRAAIQEFVSTSQFGVDALAAKIGERIRAGLEFSGLFTVIDPKAFLAGIRDHVLEQVSTSLGRRG